MNFPPGPSIRQWTFQLHSWCGLALGLYAIVIGLSGAMLVWQDELEAAEYPQFHPGDRGAAGETISTGPDGALATVRAAFPKGRPVSLTWPNSGTPFWMSYVLLGSEAREVYVDPASGQVAGVRDPRAGWVGWLGRLHTSLLVGSVGRQVNTYAACLLLGLCVTGVTLWWPRKRLWRIEWSGGWWKFFWQAHHVVGASSVLFVALLCVTGTYFYWTSAYVGAVSAVFARTVEPRVGNASGKVLSMSAIETAALVALPGVPIHRIAVLEQPTQAVRVTYREATPQEFHLVSTVFLHPVSGEVLLRSPMAQRPAGDSLLTWISVLHFGTFGGWPVKVLWSALSLSLPLLAVSGLWTWWGRLRRDKHYSAAPRDSAGAVAITVGKK